ncbi:AraC family transcriptional regulator [Streptomyces griseorubiginosus]|uniref:AraC family transcriptional regulator n=1 Tax=Streptomyces griseorubiginosus TaxID=67304 RepID=UPI0033E540E7
MSKNEIDESIERTLAVIRQCYGEKISLSYLAEVAGLSSFHFCRVFQRQVGMTPIKFLSFVRMQRAKYLLESTTLSVAAITREVGYGSVTTFTTRFSAMFGIAPGQLRRQHVRNTQDMTSVAAGDAPEKLIGGQILNLGRVDAGVFQPSADHESRRSSRIEVERHAPSEQRRRQAGAGGGA